MLYGRAQDHLRYFVSSKMSGGSLKPERKAAIREVESSPWHKAWAWEISANAGPYSSKRLCVANAKTSDGLILIVSDELTAMTSAEYRAARRAGVPRFIFVKDGIRQTDELSRFIQRERAAGATTRKFRNLAELRTEIRTALRAYGVRSHRVTILLARRDI